MLKSTWSGGESKRSQLHSQGPENMSSMETVVLENRSIYKATRIRYNMEDLLNRELTMSQLSWQQYGKQLTAREL